MSAEVKIVDVAAQARAFIAASQPLDALSLIERARQTDPGDPTLMSLFGFLHALERGQIREGTTLCVRATETAPELPEVWLDLGNLYLRTGRRAEAVTTFRTGLRHCKDDEGLKHALAGLGLRRPLVFTSLPRDHVFNRWAGRLRAVFSPKTPMEHG